MNKDYITKKITDLIVEYTNSITKCGESAAKSPALRDINFGKAIAYGVVIEDLKALKQNIK